MMFMNKADKILGMLTEVRKIGYDATIVAVKDRLSPLTIELIQKLEQSLESDHRDLCCGVCGQYKKHEGHGTHDECRC